jgi:hypothetical protein
MDCGIEVAACSERITIAAPIITVLRIVQRPAHELCKGENLAFMVCQNMSHARRTVCNPPPSILTPKRDPSRSPQEDLAQARADLLRWRGGRFLCGDYFMHVLAPLG